MRPHAYPFGFRMENGFPLDTKANTRQGVVTRPMVVARTERGQMSDPNELTTEEATGETPLTLKQAECDGLKLRCDRMDAERNSWKAECLNALEGTDATSVGGLIAHLRAEVDHARGLERSLEDAKSRIEASAWECHRYRELDASYGIDLTRRLGWFLRVVGWRQLVVLLAGLFGAWALGAGLW